MNSMNRFHPYGQEPGPPGTPGMTFAGFGAFATPGLARPLPPGPPPGARPLPPGPPPVARPLPRGAPPGMLSCHWQSPAGLADRMGGAQHGVSAAVLGVDGARRAVMEQPSECLQYLVPGSSRPFGLRGPHGPQRTNSQQTNSGQELLLNHQKRKNLARREQHMRKMMEKAEAELEEMIAARAKEQQGTIQPPHPGELANLPHNLSRGEGSVRGADHHRLDRSGIEEFQQRARLPSAGSGEGGAGQHGGSDKQRKGLVNRSCLKSSLERPPSQAQIAVCCLPSFFLLQRVVFWSPAFLFFLSPHRPLHTCTPCNLTRACVCVYVW